ncbi:MAG: guanylate kinase [Leuconostoc mesenteroides]|uniref:Guanylate kinase n=1 Tax=Leuconostoc mesenteroides subsp. cremoris ATCC 19254 TaxID=586220 RepID=C2KHF7_LEUMC|nr:guanylate kinase [Leuconostoc mesenteroides]EQC82950.1 guanylate kinase [Leuconostoc mesenteroides subsp. cremoris TIFN8]KDA52216.1 Guanylate kinase [Leuconostoc mesenteroides subsp. cremoris T26]EEJ43323.1 guanylate kinase [Leuconostoc mesenteroides subsp. cremoris ATCC 19254]MDG9751034.1 guanylate kinase [Leuconostoc mesenteroides]ORI35942.1 guanylate kinase [Leuconostoc mesenteroides subsp. cremoris]
MTQRGLLIVLSGPSGVGKGTVRKAIFEEESIDFQYSISATTRQPRAGEVGGEDYFFVTREQFEEKINNGDMLEYAKYVSNYYGTPKSFIDETLASGRDVFLEIDVQGALQVKSKMPEGIYIFLTLPDLANLRDRLVGRGTDSADVIEKRVAAARDELKMMINYDYSVENDVVSNAVERIKSIITAERLRVTRVFDKIQ